MVDEMRKQLDALMGADRNGDMSIKSFQDGQVCKLFLAGLCPHELFTNTKRDLRPCKRVHSMPLKSKYDEERKGRDFGYEDELERLLRSLVRECDHEIEMNKRKLAEEEQTKLVDPFEREIKELEERQAAAGEEGNVDEYNKIGLQIDELKVQRAQKQTSDLPEGEVGDLIAQHGPNGPQHQALRVCEICASFLSSKDDEKRLQDHYIGKLHQGFQVVREKLVELEKRPDRDARAVEDRDRDFRRDDRRGGDRDYDRGYRGGGRDRGYGGGGYDRDRDYRSRERDYRDGPYRGRGGYRGGRDDREYGRDRGRYRSRSRSRSPPRRDYRDYERRRDRSPSPSRVRSPYPPSAPQQYFPPQ